ncbi:MAG: hypothetical protein ACXABY_07030 [Candidatus Thorarchaeota archaeon]|jgi:hypothetical protein
MNRPQFFTVLATALVIFGLATVGFAGQETCPSGGDWIKVDSGEFAPVDGAVEYCFKAGSDNSQGCEGGIFRSWPLPDGACGLSHWSYRLGDPTPTPPQPTPTNTPEDPTPTPTETPVNPTPTPKDPTPTPTQPTPWPTPPTEEPCVVCEPAEDYDPYDIEIIVRHVEAQTCLFYIDFDGSLNYMGCFDTCGVVDPCGGVCEQ